MWKKYTYGAILVLHAGSTFSSVAKYMDLFNNLLFLANARKHTEVFCMARGTWKDHMIK